MYIANTEGEGSMKKSFFQSCTLLYNFFNKGQEMASGEYLEKYIIQSIDFKISKILPLFDQNREEYLKFIDLLNIKGCTEEIFESYFEVIIHAVTYILEVNIGLSFTYEKRKMKVPFFLLNEHKNNQPYLLVFQNETFYPIINVTEFN